MLKEQEFKSLRQAFSMLILSCTILALAARRQAQEEPTELTLTQAI